MPDRSGTTAPIGVPGLTADEQLLKAKFALNQMARDVYKEALANADSQSAPKWSPTPVVHGATMKERDGSVAIDGEVVSGDLRRLANAV